MENIHENPLGTEPIGKLLVKFAVPSCIAMIVNALYNIVDQIFIGQGVGYLGNGATNTILPLTIFTIAIALLFGDGCAAFFSMKLGEKRPEEAAKGVGTALICAMVFGIAVCILMNVFLTPICHLTGVTDLILPYALDYGHIIVSGFPFVAFSCCFASIIRADGSPIISMVGLIAGCVTNIVLDYIFVFPMQMGVKGAALATIIGQAVNCVIFLFYFTRFKHVKLVKEIWRVNLTYLKRICRLGSASFIIQISVVFIIIVVNNLLIRFGAKSEYGPEIPLTALGITMKVNNILLAIMNGIGAGALPIIAYNYGAGNQKRIRQAVKMAIGSAMICGAIATIFFQCFPYQIMAIFGAEGELYIKFGVLCLRVYLMFSVLDGLNNVIPTCFQAMNRPGFSVISSTMRQIGFMVPAQIIMAYVMGVTGILWGGVIAAGLSFILNVIMLQKCMKIKS